MLIEDQNSNLTKQLASIVSYTGVSNIGGASIRNISPSAESKIATNPELNKLNSHQQIVTMNHASEYHSRLRPIEDTSYMQRNYLAR